MQNKPGGMPQFGGDLSQQMSEQGMQQMAQQAQQSGNPASNSQHQPTHQPREVGTVKEEAVMMATDIFEAFKDMLGLKRPPKTPEEQAQLQQFHQKWQQLDAEQQQAAQVRIQEELQRKQMMEQEEEAKKAQEQQEKEQQSLNMPSGKVSGQATLDKMQQDRKGMGGASG